MGTTRKSKAETRKPAESYTVLARRYRPQQFGDLVGQEPVAQALLNALKSNRVAHAYLFTGARGVGKTSTARILAKALNCVNGPTATPCGECDMCRGIASGDDVDVLEIDGASNRGIDEVREIRNNVQYRPSRSRYKIYIIDEVHMLTTQAFNALLKTLEEPPEHVKFIFATTEVQKIPVTILSRCQRFDFAGIGTTRIVDRLREIVAHEGLQADDEALEVIARRAGGSMRDAQSLLDQLLAFGGERLTPEQVHQLLGTAHDDRVAGLASAILTRDPKNALDLFQQAANEGLQLGELLDQLIAYWRDLMIVRCAGSEGRDLSVPSRLRPALTAQAASLQLDTILAGLDILAATKARLRGSNHPRVLMEMALVRLGRLDDLVSLAQLAEWAGGARTPDRGARSAGVSASPTSGATAARFSSTSSEPLKKKPLSAVDPESAGRERSLSAAALPEIWQEILTQVGPMLASELQKAEKLAISGPNTLVLGFPSRYNVQREHCQEPARVARIEEALRKITGKACQLRFDSVTGPEASPKLKASDGTDNSPSRYRRQRAEAMQEPLLKRAIDLFDAQVVHVDDGFGAAPSAAPERGEAADSEDV